MVSYTIWSRDRLLGETDLGWVRCITNVRSGFFHPSELGARFMPTVCGVSPTIRELSKVRQLMEAERDDQADGVPFEVIRQTPEYADMLAAMEHERGLSLELRGPDGTVIPTDDIFIQDNEHLLSLADKADENQSFEEAFGEPMDPELEEAIAHDMELLFGPGGMDDWESGDWVPEDDEPEAFPRYQIHVRLINDADVP